MGESMTKTQGQFEKRPRDFYATPAKAALPLELFLPPTFTFAEPCAGDGALVGHLEGFGGSCLLPLDIEPQADWITRGDANNLNDEAVEYCDFIITNPPFTWNVLKPLMEKWIDLRPTILLLPADFMHNVRFGPFLTYCEKIVSIGRVKWIEGSKGGGVENYAWMFFNQHNNKPTEFYGR